MRQVCDGAVIFFMALAARFTRNAISGVNAPSRERT
jgi:hypothetical protein